MMSRGVVSAGPSRGVSAVRCGEGSTRTTPAHHLTAIGGGGPGYQHGQCTCGWWVGGFERHADVVAAYQQHLSASVVGHSSAVHLDVPTRGERQQPSPVLARVSDDRCQRGEWPTRAAGSLRSSAGLSASPAAPPPA